jgi:hypothetical protein
LAAAIAVEDAAPRRGSQGDGHLQGPNRQIAFHPVADGPADDASRMQIEDDSEIQPALAGPDVADIARPFLVRSIRREVTVQQVWRDVERMVASVVALNFLVLSTTIPFSRIRRPTRRCPTSTPTSFNSSVILGRP